MIPKRTSACLASIGFGIAAVVIGLLCMRMSHAAEPMPSLITEADSAPARYADLLDAIGDWADDAAPVAEQVANNMSVVRKELNILAAMFAAEAEDSRTKRPAIAGVDVDKEKLLDLGSHWFIARDRLQPAYLGLVLLRLRIDQEKLETDLKTKEEIKAREREHAAERKAREQDRAEREREAQALNSPALFGGGLFGGSNQTGTRPMTTADVLRAQRRQLRDDRSAVASGNAKVVDSATGREVKGRERHDYWKRRRESIGNSLPSLGPIPRDDAADRKRPTVNKPFPKEGVDSQPTVSPRAALDLIDTLVNRELARLNPVVMKIAGTQLAAIDPDRRLVAIQGLGYWSGNRKDVMLLIERAMSDDDTRVRECALSAFLHMKVTDVELRSHMKSDNAKLRAASLKVLELRKSGDKSAGAIAGIGLTDDEASIRAASYSLIDALLPKATDRAEIVRAAMASKTTGAVLDALNYIVAQPDELKKLLTPQINRLRTHADEIVRAKAEGLAP